MGVEPFLIASSLILTSAQRLCRIICDRCKEEIEIPKDVLKSVGGDMSELLKIKHFYKGRGCAKCKNTGYYGRMGILEALLIDDEIRDMIVEKASTDEIKKIAVTKKGMKTLRDNALENLKMGRTTLEEVLSITSEE
jgi:type II secretory ATPase GspE/PulE/Tfp pilus assembly ATPase PilB-like protein